MIVITLSKVPQSLRGDLTKWCQEVQTGIYVGNFSARIRDALWTRIMENIGLGEATMIYSTNNELGYDFKTTRKDKEIVDLDGIPLMMHLKEKPDAIKHGFSKAAHYHQAHVASKYLKKSNIGRNDVLSSVVVIDIETTGLNVVDDDIISIGAVKYASKDKELKTFYRLIKTNREIPGEISKVTKIDSKLLSESGVNLGDALNDLSKFVADRIVIGYNLSFDYKFLNRDYKNLGQRVFTNNLKDLLPIVKKNDVFADNYKLSTILSLHEIENKHPHNSLSDAKATMQLLEKLIENGKIRF